MRNFKLLLIILAINVGAIYNQAYAQPWMQKGIDINGEAANDNSGFAVSMPDANTVAIGAVGNDGSGSNAGQVRVYAWSGSAWVQKGADINGEAANDYSGNAVSMPDANTVAIGAFFNDGNGLSSGHVRIYTWSGSAWVQQGADIDGEAAGDGSGFAVSMPNATTVAIGAPQNDGNGTDAGHVRVYIWNGSSWVQKGSDINGEAAGDYFGCAVSMPDANTVAVGAEYNDGSGTDAGHARVYIWNGSAWVQKGVDINGEAAGDNSGRAISMADPNNLVIGAYLNDGNGTSSGHMRAYTWNGSAWVQKGADVDGEAANDQAGYSVSMPDANTIAYGANGSDGSFTNAGQARVFSWSGSAWVQVGADINGELTNDNAGSSIYMPDANTIASGAPYNDGSGIDAGHVRVYNLCVTTTSSISATACVSYDSPSGNYTWTTSGTYMDTILNQMGCDSVMTINLTVNNPNSSTISEAACSTYTSPSGNYTWTSAGTYMDTILNMAGCDSVITINLTLQQTSSTISPTACLSYTSPSGNYTWTNSGTYMDTIQNTAGCDSVMTIVLTINTVDVSVTNNSPTLMSNVFSGSYQWLDCDNGMQAIAGETNQSFTASANGNYAVVVTQGGCTDTSACEVVANIGLVENQLNAGFVVSPNPTSGYFTVNFDKAISLQVTIRDISGREVLSKTVADVPIVEVQINGESGTYFMELTDKDDHRAIVQIIKQ